ncbi:hypothetical protein [Novosphingobium sp. 9U]|nr:hypothetical protein [Novosphingobium sp. 9U]
MSEATARYAEGGKQNIVDAAGVDGPCKKAQVRKAAATKKIDME